MRRSAKILILNKEGIIEKISYERLAYESVDEKSLVGYVPKNDEKKKEFMHLRVKVKNYISGVRFDCISLLYIYHIS